MNPNEYNTFISKIYKKEINTKLCRPVTRSNTCIHINIDQYSTVMECEVPVPIFYKV